tara:strand:- start:22482 stop:24305 length:1824 start_codon:yes stop_codon:yes gene_type:complete
MSNNLISSIRGFAVASVFLFHLFPSRISLGYLGVDIFILISGYLIAKSFTNKSNDNFGLKEVLSFIKKRFLRIYPSLVTFLLIILLLKFVLFGVSPATSFINELKAALISLYNWHIISKFDYNLELMSGSPILHLWSISAEVQLYMVFIFLICFSRFIPFLKKYDGLVFFIASIFLILVGTQIITLNGYFSSTWRLAEFSLGVILFRHGWRPFIFSGLAFCLISFFIGANSILLSLSASLIAVSLFKIFESYVNNLGFLSVALQSLGNKAYSYYLWHFPIIFYLNYLFDDIVIKSLFATLLTIALAETLYFLVERNRNFFNTNFFSVNFSAAVIFLFVAFAGQISFNKKIDSLSMFEDRLDPPFIEKCRSSFGQKIKDPCIFNGEGNLNIVLIGDSHAFQMSGGFIKNNYKNLSIFSYAGCPPIKNFIRQDRLYIDCNYADKEWTKMISNLESVDLVIISSRWPYYFKNDIGSISNTKGSIDENIENIELFESINKLNKANIFLIGNTPEVLSKSYDLYLQNIVRDRFKLTLRKTSFLSVPPKDIKNHLSIIAKNNKVKFFEPNLKICDREQCQIVSASNDYYFRDTNHLSSEASKLLVSEILAISN